MGKKGKRIIKTISSLFQHKEDSQLSLLPQEGPPKENQLTEEQKDFIYYEGVESIILEATAGSGKTHSGIMRVKELLHRGISPGKIVFFSFTNAAVDEIRQRLGLAANDKVGPKISTIHSFCFSVLAKLGFYKKIATFYEFINWFKEIHRPGRGSDQDEIDKYYSEVQDLFDNMDFYQSQISCYKLGVVDGLKMPVPSCYGEYCLFLKQNGAMDFSDIIIMVDSLLNEEKYLKMAKNFFNFQYIILDEYQDCTLAHLRILMKICPAAIFTLLGQKEQTIYMYANGNSSSEKLREMLSKSKKVIDKKLSINFRSDRKIVEYSNKFSKLQGKANSKEKGFVSEHIMISIDELIELLKTPDEIAVLVRTNDIIKKLETILLKKKIPIKYTNFINETDIKSYKKGEVNESLKKKFNKILKSEKFKNEHEIVHFIEMNKGNNKFLSTIHKAKGREFSICCIVNSLPIELLQKNDIYEKLSKKQRDKVSFGMGDLEGKNIFFVGVTRAKHKNYFMIVL